MAVKDDADFVMAEKKMRRVRSIRTPTEEEDADGAWYLNYDDGKGEDQMSENGRLEQMKLATKKEKWMIAAESAQ